MNNLCVFRLKGGTVRFCNTNTIGNDKISEENTVDKKDGSSDSYEQDIKSKILHSSLPYVPQHGWSKDTVAAGMYMIIIIQLLYNYIFCCNTFILFFWIICSVW